MSPIVVADTTPINYLVLIGQADILGLLFGEVFVPEAVLAELNHPNAPDLVTRWLQSPPNWLRPEKVRHFDDSVQLGKGETEAISLALELRAKVILMDERKGRCAAESRGLVAIGTLNLIDLADEKGLLDGVAALKSLRQTTFRAGRTLMDQFKARMVARRSEV